MTTGPPRLGPGLALAGLYLLAAAIIVANGALLQRPLFDGAGYAPPPYRWVERPAGVSGAAEPPQARTTTVDLTGGPSGLTITTPDGQAAVVLLPAGIDTEPGTDVDVTLEPVVPDVLGPPPPGMRFDANAYGITATYASTGEPVRLLADGCDPEAAERRCPTLIFRYALRGTDVLRADDDGWTALPSTAIIPTLELFAETDHLGTFVVVGPEAGIPGQVDRTRTWLSIALALSALLNVALLRRRQRRPSDEC